MFSYPFIERRSDCEDDHAEGTVLDKVMQSIGRFGQRKGFATIGLMAPD